MCSRLFKNRILNVTIYFFFSSLNFHSFWFWKPCSSFTSYNISCKICLMVVSNEFTNYTTGSSPKCIELPPFCPAVWPCTVLISTLHCLSSSGEKISAYLLEVLQGLINCKTHWKIWIKYILTFWSIATAISIISRCYSFKDKKAGLEISSKPPTWRVTARPKSYILIFKYQ